ncbi:ferritin-like protein [Nocardiopsis sp. EMB25]|uniref:ferritin-like domain-containing protein n=1 Tax=Nocardiopsis sp. EMB25 TaxID=2835867 RepID=UPI002283686A|nr:ferritin-like protein [Nocardiopsis sp. EMB25]MCY9784340.1 ferritin-like protein [Nocardiopsis sp. EMB25]
MIFAEKVHDAGFEIPKTLEKLREYLQAALEVEHLTIPVYMTGMYTIRPGTNRTAYYAIRSVLLEEMLHMTLAANLLNAVGGKPQVEHPNFVKEYPVKLPLSSEKLPMIGLRHFSEEALRTFLTIETPRSISTGVRESSGWTSIGQFYEAIRQGLVNLVKEKGEHEVFKGTPDLQVGPEDFYNSGGEVFAVKDLESAQTAIRVISEQGEGVHDSIWDSDDQIFGEERQLAHYFRFNEIYTGRCYSPYDSPKRPPSGPLVDVSWNDAYPINGDSKVADYKEHQATSAVYDKAVEFNTVYATLLSCLHQAFNGQSRTMGLAVPTMLELRDRAEQLYRNPHPDPELAEKGCFASATFEITAKDLEQARERVDRLVDAAHLENDEPIDLSGITAESREQFA